MLNRVGLELTVHASQFLIPSGFENTMVEAADDREECVRSASFSELSVEEN
jgi:hypothetical protein